VNNSELDLQRTMFRWKQKKRFSYIASCEEGEFSEGQSIEEANVCPSMGLRCRSVPLRWNHTPSSSGYKLVLTCPPTRTS
jgi:hypothetical protein